MAQLDDSNAGLRTTSTHVQEPPLIEENEVVKSPVVAALREYFSRRTRADFSSGLEEVAKELL